MTKYYRVKQDTFMWNKDAIIRAEGDNGYRAVEDIWNRVPLHGEYISNRIIENDGNADFFERVYPDSLGGKLYKTADQLRELYASSFKS